jgi:hypothetical protein
MNLAIKIRLALLIPGEHRWNAWVRDITARWEQPNGR